MRVPRRDDQTGLTSDTTRCRRAGEGCLDRHREEPGFYVKREGGGFVSFSLRFFPERGGLRMSVIPPDGAERVWCIHVRSGRNSPCVLVLEVDDPFPRSGETPPRASQGARWGLRRGARSSAASLQGPGAHSVRRAAGRQLIVSMPPDVHPLQ